MRIEEFGRRLIDTEDLDPVYVAIHGAALPPPRLARLLLAYWCFYNLGVSAWLSEQDDFWGACEVAARNTDPSPLGARWPRGAERRHFRGDKSVKAIRFLSRKDPETWVTSLARGFSVLGHPISGPTLETVSANMRWPLFGPWIAYKAADMLERVWGTKVEFPLDVCLLYAEPRKGLMMLNPKEPEKELDRLLGVFQQYLAPPAYDRRCNVQEVETILCKYKSYRNGHYWVGKDVHEVRHGLEGWGDTAGMLLKSSPKEVVREGCLL